MSGTGSIGIIGAGAMGLPILGHIARSGAPVICYDTNPATQERAREAGADTVADLAGLVGCETVLVFVPTDDDVRAVGRSYLTAGARNATLVICSSVTPATCAELAAGGAAADVHVIDAALTGGVRAAEGATISLLVGGDVDAVDRLRPLLKTFCARVSHLGPLGAGQVGKSVNNLIHWGQIVAIEEALRFGALLGVPVSMMRAALTGGPTDSRTLQELQHMRFTWYDKDIANAEAMAADAGIPLKLAPIVRELMRSVTIADVADLLADRIEPR
jgi:3-hydroxyisobutyrate dehydrogenase-like beta-hydroxyacid dehydrogenase